MGAVLSRIIDGDRFSAAEVTRDFYTLQLADFVNVFASTDHVLAALEFGRTPDELMACLLYTSDAADERSSVDLGGRRIIK